MGNLFYLLGVLLAGYTGYSGFDWYYIFISSLIMTVGFFIVRSSQIQGIISNDGVFALPKLLIIQIVIYSIITTPIFFIGALFS
ncbi:MAG: hypothetical protein N0E44_12650 [Candidatus Thiodiazotropha lotti]|nr:hypothetical protein [Candidatus Thiodiazotropha lotti]MCW4220737.1 hypothetical protein [Candidatus Thiodiazotropha lotti]